MILGLHHAAIAVDDMEAALSFYCGLLGFEIAMKAQMPGGIDVMSKALGLEDSGFSVRMIKKGNSCIELFQFDQQEAGEQSRPVNRLGISHIALASNTVADDFERLSANGVEFNAPLLGDAPGRFAYGRDPFGNVIELLEHNPVANEALILGWKASSDLIRTAIAAAGFFIASGRQLEKTHFPWLECFSVPHVDGR